LADWNELSWINRMRRLLYTVLQGELDRILIHLSLIESYCKFIEQNGSYPFVESRDLKPRTRCCSKEFEMHNQFLVIFCEGSLPSAVKKYIRIFDANKVTKENLGPLVDVYLSRKFYPNLRYFNSSLFPAFLKELIPVDYALLIQLDPSVRSKHRFMLSHFHVKIDWSIAEAAEMLGKQLRYISKNLYENGDKYAEMLQQKFFEYYGFHYTAGGRRTAAAVAFQYLKQFPFISTVYVSSSESRTLTRISEYGVSKFVLIQMTNQEMDMMAQSAGLSKERFAEVYLVGRVEDKGVGIFQVVYGHTNHSRPPADGKLRRLRPDYHWLTVHKQLLIPLPTNIEANPIPFPRVYSL